MTDDKQPFLSHLEELRRRLVICAIAIGIGFVFSYIFAKQLFSYLILPLTKVLPDDSQLIFTNLPEMFIAYIKVALVAGIILAIPIISYQLWMFLAPALYQKEKNISSLLSCFPVFSLQLALYLDTLLFFLMALNFLWVLQLKIFRRSLL